MPLSPSVVQIFSRANDIARKAHHPYVMPEHLLLALFSNSEAMGALGRMLDEPALDIPRMQDELKNNLRERFRPYGQTSSMMAEPSQELMRVSNAFQKEVDKTARPLDGCDLLLQVIEDKESFASTCLLQNQISADDIKEYIKAQHGAGKQAAADKAAKNDFLDKFTVNLNERAREGKIDPVIGREDEIVSVARTLCRRRKNNPMLVGEPGVGKTAIAEGLAKQIEDETAPDALLGCTIYSLDMGALLAGTKYRGDFEERIKGVLKAVTDNPKAILFIDEIHTLIGTGAAGGSAMDASNLMKPLLGSGRIRTIGATTFTEYKVIQKDAALARRFQKIDVNEPSVEDTIRILTGLKGIFEQHHGVKYTLEALRMAAEMSAKYITGRFLPDKAIDLVDDAGAIQKARPKDKRVEVIDDLVMADVVAKAARIPPQTVKADEREKLKSLDKDLKTVVFGQDEAIGALASAVKMGRAGLGNKDKPIGSFLFTGPTGVGKTEVAKQLAKLLVAELVRFDMSEYMEAHAVSRLIGAPPGYVGFDQGGLLTDAVSKQPNCVLLLDEIEKAHPDLYNILLQVMDHGTLTDNNGRKADFRNAIIIMTSNAGAAETSKPAVGFTGSKDQTDTMVHIRRAFTPEFRNRLDSIVTFHPLNRDIIVMVVDKFIKGLQDQLAAKNVTSEFTNAARAHFAKAGFDPLMGARPMERVIQDKVRRVLADELLFGRLAQGGHVRIDYNEASGTLDFDFPPVPQPVATGEKPLPDLEPEPA